MTRIFPHLFAYKIEHIKNNLNNFINLGFSEQEIINLFHIIPDLDLITPEEIYTLLNILHQIGCTNPTIKHIISFVILSCGNKQSEC